MRPAPTAEIELDGLFRQPNIEPVDREGWQVMGCCWRNQLVQCSQAQ